MSLIKARPVSFKNKEIKALTLKTGRSGGKGGLGGRGRA